MNDTPFTLADLDALTSFDTPTICNALERLAPQTQACGYTTRPFVCGFPQQQPVIGYARTAAIRAAQPHGLSAPDLRKLQDDYYRSIDAGPKPSLVVIQDLDVKAGAGAFWGEVQSAIHVGLGARAAGRRPRSRRTGSPHPGGCARTRLHGRKTDRRVSPNRRHPLKMAAV